MNKIISFPHLGNYYIPLKYLLKKISRCEVIVPDKNNRQTITNGTKYSPDEICVPFKYNLGCPIILLILNLPNLFSKEPHFSFSRYIVSLNIFQI